jgi:hypothetical protein
MFGKTPVEKEALEMLKTGLEDTIASMQETLKELRPRSHAAIETRGALRENQKWLKLIPIYIKGIKKLRKEKQK